MTTVQRIFSLALVCAVSALTINPATSFSEEKKAEAAAQPSKMPAPKSDEAGGKTAAKADAPSPNEPLAKVNGIPITRSEVDRAVKVFLSQNRSPQPPTAEQLKQLHDAALEQIIAAEMLYQAGQKQEPKNLDKLADEKIAQSRARFPSQEEFEKALKNAGLNEKELKELTRKDIIINNLVEKEVASKITISDSDAEKFYNENIGKFKQDERVRASHILIGVDAKASADDKNKAKAKAEDILKKIKAGEDFAALAKANSTCPSSSQGGDLGYFSKGQMVPPFEKAAFALKPGEVSDVVETQFGYHIIKLTDKKEAQATKFEDAKEKIKEYLKGQKIQQAVSEYISKMKGQTKIERISSK